MISGLVERIRGTSGCRLRPPAGQPSVEPLHAVPPDLSEFYDLTGGADLFTDRPYGVTISGPSELVLTNRSIPGCSPDGRPEDLSDTWYVIGRGGGGDLLSIDLDPGRQGRCYDSFHEIHAVAGSCPIIAVSFTDLVGELVRSGGEHPYWLQTGFASLGDAYDDR